MSVEGIQSVDRWQIFAAGVVDYVLIVLDTNHCVVDCNPAVKKLLGYELQEILGQPVDILFTPEDRQSGFPAQEVALALQKGSAEHNGWHVRKDGSRFLASGVLTPLRDSSSNLIGFARIIRERSDREHTALIHEVHHRVKNNLQMIMSLIRLQADRLTDARSLQAFEETEARVRTISSVHERLYASSDFAIVQAAPYLNKLVREIKSSLDHDDRITITTDAADLALEIGEAVPLALIANELLQNAFRHAFPDGRLGEVSLTLIYDGQAGRAQLQVRDNGVGLPADVDFETHDSLGFDIVRILVTQLHGEMRVESGPSGVRFAFAFPVAS